MGTFFITRRQSSFALLFGIFLVEFMQLKPIIEGEASWYGKLHSVESLPEPAPERYTCTCVHCQEDEKCGGLWKGSTMKGNASYFTRISVVLSHCLAPLGWFEDFTRGFEIDDLTIISKCNKTVEGAPVGATIINMPNVGRCDHSYAHWLAEFTKRTSGSTARYSAGADKRIVFFFKDNRSIHQPGKWRPFAEMLRIASDTGFACGMEPTTLGRADLSAYYERDALNNFRLGSNSNKAALYGHPKTQELFPSRYRGLGEWVKDMGFTPKSVVQVCYAGFFAATERQIRRQPRHLWFNLSQSLSRGDNIEEGHFAERSWASFLSSPFAHEQAEALRKYANLLSTNVYTPGALKRK